MEKKFIYTPTLAEAATTGAVTLAGTATLTITFASRQ